MERKYRDYYEEQRAMRDLHPNVRKQVIGMTQNFTVIDGQAYDEETGENITHKLDIQPIITKPTPRQLEGKRIKQELAAHEKEMGGFIYAFFTECRSMEERFSFLSQSDLARLMYIGTYVAWESNHLIYDNGRKINKRQLGELVGGSRNTFSSFYKKLTDNGIITETDTGIVMNPEIFYRGRISSINNVAKSSQYTRLFRNTVRDLYRKYGGRALKQLAIIYMILPYVNFNYNIISHNPSEVQAEKVSPMTVDELAKTLGYSDYRKLKPILNSIKHDGKSVFGFFEMDGDKRRKKIVVNPSVIYAGNGKHLDAIKILFK